ncbi:hypothetical protein PT2222_120307 [Paraburkholderia tropica]
MKIQPFTPLLFYLEFEILFFKKITLEGLRFYIQAGLRLVMAIYLELKYLEYEIIIKYGCSNVNSF